MGHIYPVIYIFLSYISSSFLYKWSLCISNLVKIQNLYNNRDVSEGCEMATGCFMSRPYFTV